MADLLKNFLGGNGSKDRELTQELRAVLQEMQIGSTDPARHRSYKHLPRVRRRLGHFGDHDRPLTQYGSTHCVNLPFAVRRREVGRKSIANCLDRPIRAG